MASIVKRVLSGVLAAWFAVFSVLLPLSASAATFNAASNWSGRAWYVPATGTGVAGSAVVAGAASALARANPWVAALTVGTPIMQYLIEQRAAGNVQVAAGANADAPTPAGWSGPNSPPGTATVQSGTTTSPTSAAPGTVSVTPQYAIAGIYGTTLGGTCDAWRTSAGRVLGNCGPDSESLPSFNCRMDTGYPGAANCWNNNGSKSKCDTGYAYDAVSKMCINTVAVNVCSSGSTLVNGQCVSAPTCPPGYGLSGNACVLTDVPPVQWPADGVPTMVPRVGQDGVYDWWPSARDPDPPGPATGLHLKNAQYFTDPYGNTIFQQLTPLSTGGVQLGQMLQTTQNGQTVTTINNVITGPDGVVIKAEQRTVQGDIPTIANSQNPTGEPTAIQFPDDYNREITQQKILTGEGAPDPSDWSASVAQQKQTLEDAIKNKIEDIPNQYGQDKSSWFSWVWTPPVGECSAISGSVHGKSVTWNICPYVEKVRDVIGWLFAIFGTWMVYNEMFRRED